MGGREAVSRTLIEVAALLVERGDSARSACALGAAETLRVSVGVQPYRPDASYLSALTSRVREDLGDEPYRRSFASGGQLQLDEALGLLGARAHDGPYTA